MQTHHSALRPVPVRGAGRLARGWAGAVLATGLAAASHSAAAPAGHAVPPVVWLWAIALAAPLCTVLAGHMFSLWRVVAGVLGSQLLFHLLYSMAGGPVAPEHLPSGDHADHLGHASGQLAGFAAHAHAHGGHDQAGAGMLLAHLSAAVVTVALIRHGERLVAAVAGRVLDASVAVMLLRWRPAPGRLCLRVAAARPTPLRAQTWTCAASERGPPAHARPPRARLTTPA